MNNIKNIKNKIDIIKKILEIIEEEYRFTEILTAPFESRKNLDEFCPEDIYFNLIKIIIEQSNWPDNVCGFNIHLNNYNEIVSLEMIHTKDKNIETSPFVELIWDKC